MVSVKRLPGRRMSSSGCPIRQLSSSLNLGRTAKGNTQKQMRERFRQFANDVACAMGRGWAFTIALFSVIAWAITGPIFGFSDTWQLVINTATTVITFLMVFLVQATQNRDSKAIQLKLDELSRVVTRRGQAWSAWSICPNQKFRNWMRNL
jgi:type IV secretory pathway VirB3-like protein